MKFAARVDTATREVRGHWAGPGPSIPASTAEVECREVTEAEHKQIATALRWPQGPPRWRVTNGGQVQEIPDPRPIVRFTPTQIELDVGDPPGQVLMEVVDSNGNVRTNVNVTRRVPLTQNKRIRLTFVNGATTVTVPTGAPRRFVIDNNEHFQVVAPLFVEVDDTEL